MFWLWISVAAIVYSALLALVLIFFAAVGKMNDNWDRVLRESDAGIDKDWRRAA